MANEGISGATGSHFPSLSAAAPEWKYADEFTVRQVAYLWGGHEPIKRTDEHHSNIPLQFQAIVSMLLSSIQSGNLRAKKKFEALSADENARVSRADLMKLCEGIKQFPEFLFDTTAIDSEPSDEAALSNSPSFAAKRGGRPELYPWDKIVASLILIDGLEELPRRKMQICKTLLSFVRAGYSFDTSRSDGKAPDVSAIQKKLGGVIDAYIELRDKMNKEKRI